MKKMLFNAAFAAAFVLGVNAFASGENSASESSALLRDPAGSCAKGTCNGTQQKDRKRDGSCKAFEGIDSGIILAGKGTCDGTKQKDRKRDGSCTNS